MDEEKPYPKGRTEPEKGTVIPRAPGKTPELRIFLFHPLPPLGADMGTGLRMFCLPQPQASPVLRVVAQME